MDIFYGCDLTCNEQLFFFFQLTHLKNSWTVIQQLSGGQKRAIPLFLMQIWLDLVLQIINTYMYVWKTEVVPNDPVSDVSGIAANADLIQKIYSQRHIFYF